MFSMKKIILLTLIIINLFLVNLSLVNACSCISPAPPKESLEESTAVFVGKVIDIDVPSGIVVSNVVSVNVTFEVSKIWKGHDYKNLVLTTARGGASCGYPFKENEVYIVYAYGEEGILSTHTCSRTRLLSSAQDDLQELGAGNLPTNSGSKYVYVPQTSNSVLMVSIVGVVVLIGIVVLFIRKYKK